MVSKTKGDTTPEELARRTEEWYRKLLTDEYYENYLEDLQQQGIIQVPYQERNASATKQSEFFTAIELKYQDR